MTAYETSEFKALSHQMQDRVIAVDKEAERQRRTEISGDVWQAIHHRQPLEKYIAWAEFVLFQ